MGYSQNYGRGPEFWKLPINTPGPKGSREICWKYVLYTYMDTLGERQRLWSLFHAAALREPKHHTFNGFWWMDGLYIGECIL